MPTPENFRGQIVDKTAKSNALLVNFQRYYLYGIRNYTWISAYNTLKSMLIFQNFSVFSGILRRSQQLFIIEGIKFIILS